MPHFKYNYKDDLIHHLKHGPVKITVETAECLYLEHLLEDDGATIKFGPVTVSAFRFGNYIYLRPNKVQTR